MTNPPTKGSKNSNKLTPEQVQADIDKFRASGGLLGAINRAPIGRDGSSK